MPVLISAPAATSKVVPGNSRLRNANDLPKAVMNMTAIAQSRCALMNSSSGWARWSIHSVGRGRGRPSAIYAGATVAAQGTDFSRDDMIGRELIPPGLGYAETVGGTRDVFADLNALGAREPAPVGRSAGGAGGSQWRVAAQSALADLPLRRFFEDRHVMPYEADEITRLIIDTHDAHAFAPIAPLTVGDLRDWLLADAADPRDPRRHGRPADARDGGGG